ncbi:hypothetical protein FA95DRAFT_1604857 [Auriscalpium vulgare]|uniref:Uncharacterized protein n=1 Tax=Auriscalpium vulgare TaxID=40419 RepID=A0ACB8RZ73_9AGAM|nr:hypothetical protein FA95DRAFT_1604857 [Auriscalpium vulgare]
MASPQDIPPGTLERPSTENEIDKYVQTVESPDLWLEDGNIIIRTLSQGTPPRHTLYKVHKHVLALHCSAFATLFNGPQGAFDVGSECHDGLPIMDLPDDPDDVSHFLKALYFPQETQRHKPIASLPMKERWSPFPASYYGILRLTTKYDAQEIRNLVIPVLKAQWPSTLKAYDLLLGEHRGRSQRSSKVISLASSCSIPDILPFAFYALACRMRFSPPPSTAPHLDGSFTGLCPEDLCRLITGLVRLDAIMRRELFAVTSNWTADCPLVDSQQPGHVSACQDIGYIWEDSAAKDYIFVADPLYFLLRKQAELARHKDLCDHCRKHMTTSIGTLREALWKHLPTYFGFKNDLLASWGDSV